MPALLPPARTMPPSSSRPALRRWLNPGMLIGLLLATALGVTILTQLSRPAPAPATADSVQIRTLRFADQPDGAVAAIDNNSGVLVQRFEGEQGFLRGTLRAMVRERRMRGIGAEQPFELIRHRDGRLTLHDPLTGTRIALESFGPDNTRVYARLLD